MNIIKVFKPINNLFKYLLCLVLMCSIILSSVDISYGAGASDVLELNGRAEVYGNESVRLKSGHTYEVGLRGGQGGNGSQNFAQAQGSGGLGTLGIDGQIKYYEIKVGSSDITVDLRVGGDGLEGGGWGFAQTGTYTYEWWPGAGGGAGTNPFGIGNGGTGLRGQQATTAQVGGGGGGGGASTILQLGTNITYRISANGGTGGRGSYNSNVSHAGGGGTGGSIIDKFDVSFATVTLLSSSTAGSPTKSGAIFIVTASDVIPPSVTLSQTPTTPTNADVVINAIVTDESGVSVKKWAKGSLSASYFVSSGNIFSGDTFTVTENAIYTVYARDPSGNETIKTITVSNIDRTPPSITLSQYPTLPTNGDVTITVNITDESGISIEKWAKGSQSVSYFASSGNALNGNSFMALENGVYTVYAKDPLNNETIKTITVSNIDKISPTIIFNSQGNSTAMKSHSVDVVVSDNVAISSKQYAWSISTTTPTSWSSLTGETIIKSNGDGDFYLFVNATDSAGNETITRTDSTFKFDNTPPSIPILIPSITEVTKDNITINIDYSSDSAIKLYRIDSGEWINYQNSLTITSNAIVYARAEDSAGNLSTSQLNVSNIDKLPPDLGELHFISVGKDRVDIEVSATDKGVANKLHDTPYRFYKNGSSITGWIANNGLSDTLLMSNMLMKYQFQARDILGNESNLSTIYNRYTLALDPVSVKLNKASDSEITFTINNNGGNDITPSTRLVLKNKGTSTVVATSDWSKDTIRTFTGLSNGTSYDIYLTTRNEEGVTNNEIKLSNTSVPLLIDDGGNPIDYVTTLVLVSNFRLAESLGSGITVAWENVVNQEYQVYFLDMLNNQVQNSRSDWIESNSYIFNNEIMIGNTQYKPMIITRIKNNSFSSSPIGMAETVFTDAKSVKGAFFESELDSIRVILDVGNTDNALNSEYQIRNDITGQIETVNHQDPEWMNYGLALESYYTYSAREINKNGKTSYFAKLNFLDGKDAHTKITEIAIEDDFMSGGVHIDLDVLKSWNHTMPISFNPETLNGKNIKLNGKEYIVAQDKEVSLKNTKNIEAVEYSFSKEGFGFTLWDKLNDGYFDDIVNFNTPGYYRMQFLFKNNLSTSKPLNVNYMADWIPPDVEIKSAVKGQTVVMTSNITLTVKAVDNISPYLFYSLDNGNTYYLLDGVYSDITITNINKSKKGELNNIKIKVCDINGNITEETLTVWGITN